MIFWTVSSTHLASYRKQPVHFTRGNIKSQVYIRYEEWLIINKLSIYQNKLGNSEKNKSSKSKKQEAKCRNK
jgi:hypothetical protein